jgi:phage shock protein A
MGILDRIGMIVRSNVNDMLDKSANPEADLNLFMLDMQKGIKQVEEEIYNSVAQQKMLEINATEARRKAQEWDAKAQTAVRAGRDDLATEALRLKLSAEQEAESFEKQASDQKATTTQMRAQLEELKRKYAETDQNKGNLIAKYNMAKYGQKVMGVRNPVTGLPESDYSRMEQKIMAQEARAAMDQDTLRAAAAEAELNNLQTEATLEDELAALKQRMGTNKPKDEAPKADNDKPYDEK